MTIHPFDDGNGRITLAKARFWKGIAHIPVNERQVRVLGLLLDDFEGNFTAAKWARIAKCSHHTALQDINGLIGRGVLVRNPEGGRSRNYRLAQPYLGCL